ncbi:hypothetical protein RJ55_02708 [Drechmeria coniospora]|nr:hypothetical protein RJ55_02708 [Drechmeria coniospora]
MSLGRGFRHHHQRLQSYPSIATRCHRTVLWPTAYRRRRPALLHPSPSPTATPSDLLTLHRTSNGLISPHSPPARSTTARPVTRRRLL